MLKQNTDRRIYGKTGEHVPCPAYVSNPDGAPLPTAQPVASIVLRKDFGNFTQPDGTAVPANQNSHANVVVTRPDPANSTNGHVLWHPAIDGGLGFNVLATVDATAFAQGTYILKITWDNGSSQTWKLSLRE